MNITKCVAQPSQYVTLKRKLKKNTALAGVGLVASTVATKGVEAGASALLGGCVSVAYVSALCDFVDGVGTPKAPIQKHIAYPVSLAVFESVVNDHVHNFSFHLDATLVGFLAYQFAVLSCVFTEIQEMLRPPSNP